jgi:5-methylcytosine-specific restriction endonuclease McrA
MDMAQTYTTARQAEYREYLRSPRWRLIRWLRRTLDGNRCRVCNGRGRLEVHHRSYKHRGGSLEGELRDTITLCAECHDWAHRKGLCK